MQSAQENGAVDGGDEVKKGFLYDNIILIC